MTTTTKTRRRYLGWIALAFVAYLVVLHVGTEKGRESERRAEAGNRLVNVGIQGQAYALDHDGLWPELDSANPRFVYALGSVPVGYAIAEPYQGGLPHPIEALLFGHLTRHRALTLMPESGPAEYFYLGYAVATEAEGLALVDAVRKGAPPNGDIPVASGEGTLGSSFLYQLRQDLHEHLAEAGVAEDASRETLARFPVIIERPVEGHAWVFFLDGHSEYLPYPGGFPVTARFIQALDALAR